MSPEDHHTDEEWEQYRQEIKEFNARFTGDPEDYYHWLMEQDDIPFSPDAKRKLEEILKRGSEPLPGKTVRRIDEI